MFLNNLKSEKSNIHIFVKKELYSDVNALDVEKKFSHIVVALNRKLFISLLKLLFSSTIVGLAAVNCCSSSQQQLATIWHF